MRKILLAHILVFSSYISFSQNITGTILDEVTQVPLTGVHVYLKSTNEGTTTNSKGQFNLKTKSSPNLSDTLHISSVGYVTKNLTISNLTQNDNKIFLSEDIQQIKEVSITASVLLKPNIEYKKLAPLKKGIYAFGSALIEDKIYLTGGDLSSFKDMGKEVMYDYGIGTNMSLIELLARTPANSNWQEYNGNLYIYDIHNNDWKKSELEFRKRAYHNIHVYKDHMYILGGKRLSSNRVYEYLEAKIEVFDIKRDTILIDHTNPHQAVNFASFVYKDNIIVLGGSNRKKSNGEKIYTNQVHLYDLNTGNWYELYHMPEAKETTGILVKEKIYLFGGFNLTSLKEIESFNLVTGEWETEGMLFNETERPALCYHDNIIYIFEDRKIYTYNILSKELNEYLINLDLKYTKLHYSDRKLYILGGYYEDEVSITPSSDIFSIDISEFKKTKTRNSSIL